MSSLTTAAKGIALPKVLTLSVAAALLIGFFIMITLRVSTSGMSPLYAGLSPSDSANIVMELEKMGINYDLQGNGTQIMVPADKVLRVRMSIAKENLPGNGSIVGYEIFDRSDSFGSSNFVMNINMVRALEGELSRTINSLSNIDSSRVHIVMPKQELFTRERERPSASVTIKTRGGSLENSEVASITHLIAAAVPRLTASRVAVIDSRGRLLARGDGDESIGASANTTEEYRVAYEKRLRNSIEEMIESVIGIGKVKVKVTADINFDRTTINSETFDPEGQVARSIQSNTESENATGGSGGGGVSVSTNVPSKAGSQNSASGNSRSTERADELTNFEISKTIERKVREGGTVNKLSVAVLVDGTYTEADSEEDERVYQERDPAELDKLKKLITSAIGFDETRGDTIEVINMRFTDVGMEIAEISFFDRFKGEMQSIIQTLMIALVAILAIMLVLRPAVIHLAKHTQPQSERLAEDMAAIEGGGTEPIGITPADDDEDDTLVDVVNVKGGLKSSTVRKLTEVVDKYPEESMNILRQWSDTDS